MSEWIEGPFTEPPIRDDFDGLIEYTQTSGSGSTLDIQVAMGNGDCLPPSQWLWNIISKIRLTPHAPAEDFIITALLELKA